MPVDRARLLTTLPPPAAPPDRATTEASPPPSTAAASGAQAPKAAAKAKPTVLRRPAAAAPTAPRTAAEEAAQLERATRASKRSHEKDVEKRRKRARQFADRWNGNVIAVPANGSCFYQCLIHALPGHVKDAAAMRHQICMKLTGNPTRYNVRNLSAGDWDLYLQGVRRHDYADESVLQAAADLYQVVLVILTDHEGPDGLYKHEVLPQNTSVNAAPPARVHLLHYVTYRHYDLFCVSHDTMLPYMKNQRCWPVSPVRNCLSLLPAELTQASSWTLHHCCLVLHFVAAMLQYIKWLRVKLSKVLVWRQWRRGNNLPIHVHVLLCIFFIRQAQACELLQSISAHDWLVCPPGDTSAHIAIRSGSPGNLPSFLPPQYAGLYDSYRLACQTDDHAFLDCFQADRKARRQPTVTLAMLAAYAAKAPTAGGFISALPSLGQASALPARGQEFVTYNCCSLLRTGRLETILETHNTTTVVLLQGTCLPAAPGIPLAVRRLPGWYCLLADYGRKTQRHAGVAVCLNTKKLPPDLIKYISYPDTDMLQGRFLGVRLKDSRIDTFVASVYFPPQPRPTVSLVAKKLLSFMDQLTSRLPARVGPVFGGDFNCRFGWKQGAIQPGVQLVYGSANRETALGTLVREWLLRYNLCAVSIFPHAQHAGSEHTWFSGSIPGLSSTVDYWIVSQRAFDIGTAHNACILPRRTLATQMTAMPWLTDHVAMSLRVVLPQPAARFTARRTEWNMNALLDDLHTGRHRDLFLAQVESRLGSASQDYYRCLQSNNHTLFCDEIMKWVREAASNCYSESGPLKAELNDALQERQALLRKRRRIAMSPPVFRELTNKQFARWGPMDACEADVLSCPSL